MEAFAFIIGLLLGIIIGIVSVAIALNNDDDE